MSPVVNTATSILYPFDQKSFLGELTVRASVSSVDIRRVQSFRAKVFAPAAQRDADVFDDSSVHLLVEDRSFDRLVACCRLTVFDPAQITKGYSGQFYDLSKLEFFPTSTIEIGRFCIAPGYRNPDALRILWGMITAIVDHSGIGLLFGCSSFPGTDARPYYAAFNMLEAVHLAPQQWRPTEKTRDIVRFNSQVVPCNTDGGWAAIPPLLRTYLSMGGWVSDHAVIDRSLNTLHVFTGVEVSAIPRARRDRLRRLSSRLFEGVSEVILPPKSR